jgi:hypothetical protein
MKSTAYALTLARSVLGFGTAAQAQAGADPDKAVDAIPTATPIKHVIIIVGENRGFDHLFATYEPTKKNEKVLNLLSEGIINADGTPGPNFAKAHQFQIIAPPNHGKFFSTNCPRPIWLARASWRPTLPCCRQATPAWRPRMNSCSAPVAPA